jgi:hypothetical protein
MEYGVWIESLMAGLTVIWHEESMAVGADEEFASLVLVGKRRQRRTPFIWQLLRSKYRLHAPSNRQRLSLVDGNATYRAIHSLCPFLARHVLNSPDWGFNVHIQVDYHILYFSA